MQTKTVSYSEQVKREVVELAYMWEVFSDCGDLARKKYLAKIHGQKFIRVSSLLDLVSK